MFRTTPTILSGAGKAAALMLGAWALAAHPGSGRGQTTGLVFVEAAHGVNGNLTPASAIDVNPTLASKWDLRPRQSGSDPLGQVGADGKIYESSAQNAAQLTMTVTGVSAGASYDVYAVYWSDAGLTDSTQNWTIRAGAVSGDLQLFDRTGTLSGATRGTPAVSAHWTTPPLSATTGDELFAESGRIMLLGKFGPVVAEGGSLVAYFDDFSSTNARNKVWLDGLAYAPAGTPVFLAASIDRASGELTINNPTGGPFQVKACTVTSAGGTLDATAWNRIGDELDLDAWDLLSPAEPETTPFATSLSEAEPAGTLEAGGAFVSSQVLNLGEVWRRTPIEDVSISLTLDDDSLVTITPTYTGELVAGDFNGDGEINLTDFSSLRTHLHSNVASITPAEAFSRGDMNVDSAINRTDFRLFRAAYDAAHGVGAFEAALAGVPEPGALALAGLAAAVLVFRRRRLRSILVGGGLIAIAWAPATASATSLAGWQIDPLLNGAAPFSTAGNSAMLGDGTADSADNAAIFASFTPVQLADGQQLAFTGALTTSGTTAAPSQLRFGLFKDDEDVLTPATAGWRGHLAQAGDDATPGSMLSRVPGASGFGTASFMQTGALTANLDNPALDPEHARLEDGQYTFNFTIRRFGNELELVSSFVGTTGFQNIWDTVTENDLSRISVNFAYDRAGIYVGSDLNADQVAFSQLDYSFGQMRTLVLEVNSSGAMRIVNNAGATVNMTYYEITSGGGSLNPAGWNSLDDQEGGDAEGIGWDEAGSGTASLLSEIHLQSTANVANNGRLPLGMGFQSGFQQDLEFRYLYDSGLAEGTLVRGHVRYLNIAEGDFTNDGRVNNFDYSIWKTNYGTSPLADANWDGRSDGWDFLAWQRNFGLGGPATAVPEPAGMGMCLLALAGGASARRMTSRGRAC